jgi:hypothetical protein
MQSGLMGTFLSPILGIPKFLQGIPDAHADFDSARLFGTSSHVV